MTITGVWWITRFCYTRIYACICESMPYRIITIPFNPDKDTLFEEPLKFCLNKKVVSCKPEFFRAADKAYWTVFLEYETLLEDSGKVNKENPDPPSMKIKNLVVPVDTGC